jgi:electron transport complex protein RnfB
MMIAIGVLTILGVILGAVLGVAARFFAVEGNPLEEEIAGMLPGSQCGQCGFVGCAQAAAALARGEAPVTLCPSGGRALAEALAKKLGVSADLSDHEEQVPQTATIAEDLCAGCVKCINECSVDAIVGAPKQIHAVIADICHGCGKCVSVCRTGAIGLRPLPASISSWYWSKPAVATDSKQVSL